jgi:hypothetical protein
MKYATDRPYADPEKAARREFKAEIEPKAKPHSRQIACATLLRLLPREESRTRPDFYR